MMSLLSERCVSFEREDSVRLRRGITVSGHAENPSAFHLDRSPFQTAALKRGLSQSIIDVKLGPAPL